MINTQSYRRPTVGVYLIGHSAYEVLDVTVRTIQVALLELLNDHSLLHLYTLLGEGESCHAVRLEPKGCLNITAGHGEVVVGEVVVGSGIVLAAGKLYMGVVVGDIDRAFEHQML